MDTGFQVSLFSDRWTSFLANPLSVGSPVRAQLYTESEIQTFPCAELRSGLPLSLVAINPHNVLKSSWASALTYYSCFCS